MNVLIVSQHFWPESFRINMIASALSSAGCKITVLTGQPNYPEGKIFAGYRAWNTKIESHHCGYSIVRVPIIPRGSGSSLRLVLNYLSFLLASTTIGYWHSRKLPIDVVFVYGNSPILQALTGIFFRATKRVPLVLWVQDLWPESLTSTGHVSNSLLLGGVKGLVAWIYRHCDLILAQSRSFVTQVRTMSGSVPVEYYPNPGDVESAPSEIVGRESAALPPGFNVTFGGNLGTVQSVETILDAAAYLRSDDQINFVVLGSGTRFGWAKEQVEARSLRNVHLLGRVEPHVAIDAMARSDALLITLNDGEGLNKTIPSKLVTYLGAGRPIIASMNGEAADIVRSSGAGLVCEAQNARALADIILQLKSMPGSARDSMGAAGRRWYDEHFDLTKLTKTLIGHFETAIRSSTEIRTK